MLGYLKSKTGEIKINTKEAIALYGKSNKEAINQLCQSLTESIQIRLFKGEKSTQEFIKEVKDWLRRINLEYN